LTQVTHICIFIILKLGLKATFSNYST